MTQFTPIQDLKGYPEPDRLLKGLVKDTDNPRNKAFLATLGRTGMQLTEAIRPIPPIISITLLNEDCHGR